VHLGLHSVRRDPREPRKWYTPGLQNCFAFNGLRWCSTWSKGR